MANLYKIDDLTLKQVASICDHTFLMDDTAYHEKGKELKISASELRSKAFYDFLYFAVNTDLTPHALCVRPNDVRHVRRYFEEGEKNGIKIASVIGYPNGDWTGTRDKLIEIRNAVQGGAVEIDPVIPYRALKEGRRDFVTDEMRYITGRAHDFGLIVKYILETSELTPDLIKEACEIANSCNADFVKTSTGMGYSIAREEDLIIMKQNFPRGIKISGGVVEANYRSLLRAASGRTDGMIELDPMKIRIGESKLIAEKKSGY